MVRRPRQGRHPRRRTFDLGQLLDARDDVREQAAKPAALPNPRTVKVNVYNATKHRGLARSTSVELAARGFAIGTVANDPLNKLIVGTAEIRYGSKGASQARCRGRAGRVADHGARQADDASPSTS